MGTTYSITVVSPPENVVHAELQKDIDESLNSLNQQMSTYINTSEIMLFNNAPVNQWQKISPEFLDVVILSQKISGLTNGRFDITIGPLVELWGFGKKQHKGDTSQIPEITEINAAKNRVGWQNLIVNAETQSIKKSVPLWLDVSAVAKGYAVDKLVELLEQRYGVEHYLAEIGGEMRVNGKNRQKKLWRIGIEKPALLQKEAQQLVQLTDNAIATSGDYRNYFEENGQRFSHTIDPLTGQPVRHTIASVTVIANTTAEADALATGLNVLGEEAAIDLAAKEGLAAYFIFYDNENPTAGYRTFFTDAFKPFMN